MEEDIEPTYVRGQIVRYSNPQPGEESLTFILLEDNGNRVLIQSMNFPDSMIKPCETVAKSEIAPVYGAKPHATEQ